MGDDLRTLVAGVTCTTWPAYPEKRFAKPLRAADLPGAIASVMSQRLVEQWVLLGNLA